MPRLDATDLAQDALHCEVFVIGCGPAGSTISALLAQKGRDVVAVDKDIHPRFHIGESLLPLNLPILERLGVWEELQQIGMVKHAAEFESRAHNKIVTFDFSGAFDKRYPYAFQVRRSEFDDMLLRNCAAKGVRVFEGVRVTSVEFGNLQRKQPTLVNVRLADGSVQNWRTDFLIDASGRETFLGNHFAMKRKNKRHASAAIFGHFLGARRNPGSAAGNITIAWFDQGWFWFIPLKDGTTSVGAVCTPGYMKSRRSDPTAFLMETIALSPEISSRLVDAKLTGPATATGNFSYSADRMAGEGYLLIGDAWAFIDPVFSSGVYLAMKSGVLGADVVDAVLNEPQQAAQLYRRFDRTIRRGMNTFSWLIYRMTSPVIRKLFMHPKNTFGLQSAVVSLLAGDVFGFGQVKRRLYLFRAIYYFNSALTFRKTWQSWRQRKRNVQTAGEAV